MLKLFRRKKKSEGKMGEYLSDFKEKNLSKH